MAFYSQNVWSQKHSQPVKRLLHWVLHAIGSSMAMAGMYIEYANRRKHLHSKHAIIGFIAGIFTLIGMVNGSSALWSVELRKLVAPVYLKVFHKLTGVIAFVLGEFYFMLKNELEIGSKQLKTIAFPHRDGGVVLWLRQKVYDQKFTSRYSNVSAGVGCYNNYTVPNWCVECVEKSCENRVENLALSCIALKIDP